MDKSEITQQAAKILIDTKSVLLNTEKPFTYTSGAIGPVYVDCRRLISFPKERSILMDLTADMVRDLPFDYCAGGETAGIPYAAFLAERLNKPMVYVRKKPKGFARMAQIEGYIEEGQRVLLVEDVQNFAHSVKIFIEALRKSGIIIEHASVIFEHGHKQSHQDMKDLGVTMHALCNWRDILAALKNGAGDFDAATLKSVESYLDDPKKWADDNAHKVPAKEKA